MPQAKFFCLLIFLADSATFPLVAYAQSDFNFGDSYDYSNNIFNVQINENYFLPILNLIILSLIIFLVMSLVVIIKGAFAHYLASGNEDKIAAAQGLIYRGLIVLAVVLAVFSFSYYLIKNNRSLLADKAISYDFNSENNF